MRGLFAEPTPHPAPSDGGLVKAPVAATLSPRERVRLTPMGHRPGSGDSRSFSPSPGPWRVPLPDSSAGAAPRQPK